jgi:hypothetical protein
VWWGKGSPNRPLSRESFLRNREIAFAFLSRQRVVYVQDGFVNWGFEVSLWCIFRAIHVSAIFSQWVPSTLDQSSLHGEFAKACFAAISDRSREREMSWSGS